MEVYSNFKGGTAWAERQQQGAGGGGFQDTLFAGANEEAQWGGNIG